MIDETFTQYASTYGTSNATDPVSNTRPLLGPGSESYRRLSGGVVLRRTIARVVRERDAICTFGSRSGRAAAKVCAAGAVRRPPVTARDRSARWRSSWLAHLLLMPLAVGDGDHGKVRVPRGGSTGEERT